MAINRDKAYELSENGLLFEGGVHFSSGPAIPTHTAIDGDRYFRTTDASQWYYLGSWIKLVASGFDVDTILTNHNFDTIVDHLGRVLTGA